MYRFRCVPLRFTTYDGDSVEENVIVAVKMYELPDVKCDNEKGKLLIEMNIELQPDADISLPQPV